MVVGILSRRSRLKELAQERFWLEGKLAQVKASARYRASDVIGTSQQERLASELRERERLQYHIDLVSESQRGLKEHPSDEIVSPCGFDRCVSRFAITASMVSRGILTRQWKRETTTSLRHIGLLNSSAGRASTGPPFSAPARPRAMGSRWAMLVVWVVWVVLVPLAVRSSTLVLFHACTHNDDAC